MQLTDLPEPHKTKHAVITALLLALPIAAAALSDALHWGEPPPPAIRVSLVPVPLPTPKPPEPETPPAPPKETVKPKQEAEIVRVEEKQEKPKPEEKVEKKEEKPEPEEKKEEPPPKEKPEEKEQPPPEPEEKKREEAPAEAQPSAAQKALADEAYKRRLQRGLSRYAQLTNDRIKQYLTTPDGIPDGITVIIYVRLNANGLLVDLPVILESSGFQEYDDAAMRAVMKAGKAGLPVPKEKFLVDNPRFEELFLQHRLYISPQEF